MSITTPNILQSTINYYALNGYYNHIVTLCDKHLKITKDPVLIFWQSYGHVMQGNLSEAIRGFNSIKQRKEIEYAAFVGLLYAHNQTSSTDEEEVQQLSAMIEIGVDDAPESAKLQAALFYLYSGQILEARQIIEGVDEQYTDKYTTALSIKGWINLRDDDVTSEDPTPLFVEALNKTPFQGKKDLDALMGIVATCEKKGSYEEAIKILNTVIVEFSSFTPAYTIKASLMIALGEWEQADKALQKLLFEDSNNIEALILQLLYVLTKDYEADNATRLFQLLTRSIKSNEPRNDKLMGKVTSILGPLFEEEQLLESCIELIETAKKLSPRYGNYYTIHGNLLLQGKRYKTAEEVFSKAIEIIDADTENLINESSDNVPSNKGLVKSLIMLGKLDQAVQYLSLLNDIGDDPSMDDEDMNGKRHIVSDLKYLNALLQDRMNNSDECLEYLDAAVKAHEVELKGIHPSAEFFHILNPRMLLDIAQIYQSYGPNEPLDPSEPPSAPLQKSMLVLETLIRHIPASLSGQMLYARAKYLCRDYDSAQLIINNCLKLDQRIVEAHLLAAEISYAQENYAEASNALERAISSNFQIRDWPSFNLLKARVSAATGDTKSALDVLQRALKNTTANSNRNMTSVKDTVAIYLELAAIYSKLNQEVEASRVMEEALEKFKDDEDHRELIIIANARLSAHKNEVEGALITLSSIPPTSQHFLRAKSEMAHVYLNKRNDRQSYIKCFEELVEQNPHNPACYISLADAYMNIQEPDNAIEAYDKAIELGNSNLIVEIGSKIGKALIRTHNYQDAIRYYESALEKESNKISLVLELCELRFKLHRFDEAGKLLHDCIGNLEVNVGEIGAMINQVSCLLLLSKIRAAADNVQGSVEDLLHARTVQNKVLTKLRGGQRETLLIQKQVAASICYNLGSLHLPSDQEKAILFFNEALEHDEVHEQSLLALAELALKKNDLDECQSMCLTLLRVSPSHERATMILADILFRHNNFVEAIDHFQKVLEKNPGHFLALSHMIRLLRRAGKLENAAELLVKAKASSSRAPMDPGYHFCNGLYYFYLNNPREALKEFNYARKSREWGQQALSYMIEIYLDPDTTTSVSGDSNNEIKTSDHSKATTNLFTNVQDMTDNAAAAEKLLKELIATPIDEGTDSSLYVSDHRRKVLEGRIIIAKSKNKTDIEKSLPIFIQVLSKEKDNVGALVAMAEALEKIGQTPKARNNLKRIAKLENSSEEDADDFEKGWLLLAAIHIEMNKNDEAEELLAKILKLNKSCAKAWEWRGLIYEKEKSHKDASDCYEQAWKLTRERDPGVGFKLAFNYLKSRRFLDAIDICHKVLASHPLYPRIKKEILDVARASLRP